MRTLVTGGAGFVGSHLCERLLEDGHDVLCVDNLHTGRRRNIQALEARPAFRFLEHDVRDPLPASIGAVDRVFNLACPASPVHYQSRQLETLLTNVEGTRRLLELTGTNGARMVQASTSEVYGDALVHPQDESYWGNVNPQGPRACYDEGKRVAETLCFIYRVDHGVDVRVARIFNTYGPRLQEGDGRVVSNFVVQALRGEPLTIYGDGRQTRSFCYVDDLVDGLVRLMGVNLGAQPVNLGNPSEATIRELATRVLELTGSRGPLVEAPLPIDDPRRRCPDIRRARELLGWEPRVTLDEGLRRTIEWFRNVLGLGPTLD